jgi:predicted XRE-type DNA-binding protein
MEQASNIRNYSSPALQNLLSEVGSLEMQQVQAKMQIAARIEDHLHSRAWSQSFFAERMGKRPSEISRWLSGTHNFTIEVLVSIAHHLGIGVGDLLPQTGKVVVYTLSMENPSICAEPDSPVYGQRPVRGSTVVSRYSVSARSNSGNISYTKA